MEVEIYSNSDEVELLIDGQIIGRACTGPENRYRAVFTVPYQPGELTAVAYDGGIERSRTDLATAHEPMLAVEIDRDEIAADDTDLAFVTVELRDTYGNLVTSAEREIFVEVTGSGVLQALGTARPETTETFNAHSATTFDGRALAIIRPTGPGNIDLTVSAPDLDTIHRRIKATPLPVTL